MKSYDIVIIGSGVAGATTARVAAERGLRVLLVDKRQELGAPTQCSGAVSRHALVDNGVEPDEEFINEAIYGFGIHDGNGRNRIIDYRELKPAEYGKGDGRVPLGYVVDRRRFDRYLMTGAERAGAEVWLKTLGLGYETLDERHCRVKLRCFGREEWVKTRAVVGADGIQSQVGKWAGLRTHIKITELASCLQFIVDRVETEGLLEIITGQNWAPGGYAWIFPKGHGYAEIGLGVIRTMTDRDARWHLDRFMRESFLKERFRDCRILEIQGGGVPLTAPLRKQYADQLILVGDAARHVNPITGGGIHTALNGGVLAGNFLAGLLEENRATTEENLAEYQDRWLESSGNKMWELYETKSNIFKNREKEETDRLLYEQMAEYFSPDSKYKKV